MNSNAAAKRRRAGIQPNDPVNQSANTKQTTQQSGQAQQGGYTLPQVIALVDRRLTSLEKFMKETVESKSNTDNIVQNTGVSNEFANIFNDYVQEMDTKFQMLVEEITTLKDVVLKLQSFTMEVNKALYFDKTGIVLETPEGVDSISNTNVDEKNLDEKGEKHVTFSFSPEP